MKTKAEIIQELLDEKKITVQDAMVLMEKDYQYVPYVDPYPARYPYNLFLPYDWRFGTTCNSTVNELIISNTN